MEPYETPLPPIPQPKGLRFLFGTWSGRLILINAFVFLWMSQQSGSLVMPTSDVLLAFGAKDPVLLTKGEYWRFLTPVFVHIGLIHFAFNSMGLYYVGFQLEKLLGTAWFLALYVVAGTFGNIASGVFSVAISAGASGALFGLLGCGFVVERIIGQKMLQLTGQKPRRRMYASMVGTNLVLGMLIPGIDNAAHIGGMIGGMLVTIGMLHLKPNRLRPQNPRFAAMAFSVLALLFVGGGFLASNPQFVLSRFKAAIASSKSDSEKYHALTRALELAPNDTNLRFERIKVLVANGEGEEARGDLEELARHPEGARQLVEFAEELEKGGHLADASLIREFVTKT